MMKSKGFTMEKNKTLLKKVKNYIDDNLNPAKVNVIDPTKDNFTQPLSN